MKPRNSLCLAAVGVAMLTFTPAALAADSGFYAGVQAGIADYPSDGNLIVGPVTFDYDDSNSGETDLSWSVIGGYRFNRYFAVEGGYMDLGEGSGTLTDSAGGPSTGTARFSAKGHTVGLVGSLPFGKWEPFLKVGLLYEDVELKLNASLNGVPIDYYGEADHNFKLFGSTGVNYHANERFTFRLEATFFSNLGEEDVTAEVDVKTVTLGVIYRF